ncbi:hypothetical protein [Salinispora tropica]|uniref:hypothetical protein n=1 Tax=Salinispora tropica TaxID=168695 RepID=UPI00048AC802|nr:hypothetical protein [Salinispora tropica]
MIDLDELTDLDIRDLATLLAEQTPSWEGTPQGQWRSVLELFTSRLASSDRQIVARELFLLRDAYDVLIAAAQRDGALDGRESILRRVNVLVALAESSTDDLEVDDLATAVKRMVLEDLPIALELAWAKAPFWRTSSTDEIREMRFAKNLLSPLKPIAERGLNSDDSAQVDAWLGLLPSLP